MVEKTGWAKKKKKKKSWKILLGSILYQSRLLNSERDEVGLGWTAAIAMFTSDYKDILHLCFTLQQWFSGNALPTLFKRPLWDYDAFKSTYDPIKLTLTGDRGH